MGFILSVVAFFCPGSLQDLYLMLGCQGPALTDLLLFFQCVVPGLKISLSCKQVYLLSNLVCRHFAF